MFILGLGKKKKPGLGGKWPLKVEGSVYAWATRRKKKEEEESRLFYTAFQVIEYK